MAKCVIALQSENHTIDKLEAVTKAADPFALCERKTQRRCTAGVQLNQRKTSVIFALFYVKTRLNLRKSPNKKALTKRAFYYKSAIYAAGPTGLEPATFGLTGRCANQLHHDPDFCKAASIQIF
jgi:hypothetical protein